MEQRAGTDVAQALRSRLPRLTHEDDRRHVRCVAKSAFVAELLGSAAG
jgi:hypothetical protein